MRLTGSHRVALFLASLFLARKRIEGRLAPKHNMPLPIEAACFLWRPCAPQLPGDWLLLAVGLVASVGMWGLVMWWGGRR